MVHANGVVSADQVSFGAFSFPEDAGMVSWVDMSVSSTPSTVPIAYSAQLDGTPVLTVYGESDGTGGVRNTRIGIGTAFPYSLLSVVSSTPQSTTGTLAFFGDGAGGTIIGGNASGTVLGVNMSSTYKGDLMNLQINSSTKLFVTSSSLTIGTSTNFAGSLFNVVGTRNFFTVSNGGVASSTELRTPSGTIGTLFDNQGNKYSTSTGSSFSSGVDTQVLFGQVGGGATSSALFKFATSTGVLTVGSSSLTNVSSTNITLSGYLQSQDIYDQGGNKYVTSSGGTPGGSPGQIQYNESGVFAGSSTFAFVTSTQTLNFSGTVSSTNVTIASNLTLSGLPGSQCLRLTAGGVVTTSGSDCVSVAGTAAGGWSNATSAGKTGFVSLTTATDQVGIGATSTAAKLFVQTTSVGTTTVLIQGLAAQTADLFQVASSSGLINFQISNLGVVSSTEFRSVSGTIGTLFDGQGNKYVTSSVNNFAINTYVVSSTWNAPSGIKFAQVIVTGGGGGGGEAMGDSASEIGGGGGGAGGTTIEMLTAATLGSSKGVVIGSGGPGGTGDTGDDGDAGVNSSFGTTLVTANGGLGGAGQSGGTTFEANSGGAGGAATSTGDVGLAGGAGDNGIGGNGVAFGGNGGASYWGGGGRGANTTGADGNDGAVGNAGEAYGSGGGGSAVTDTASGPDGGAGAGGVVVVFSYTGPGADLAEWYETRGGVEPGDVVAINSDSLEYQSDAGGLEKTAVLEKAGPGSKAVGVVSTMPFQVMGGEILGSAREAKPIALAGRVPVKVSDENGKIKAGDRLTVSSAPGVAMRAAKAGLTLGSALEDSNCVAGIVCKVLVLVNTSYSNGIMLKEYLKNDGVDLDAISDGADIGRILLAQMIHEKQNFTSSSTVSEILTDRLAAGLEVVTPRVVTDELVVNTIAPVATSGISMALSPEGRFMIIGTIPSVVSSTASSTEGGSTFTEAGNASSATGTVISFDAFGNAFFAGEISAKKITADQIQGLEIIADKLSTLSSTVATLSAAEGEKHGFLNFVEGMVEKLTVGRTIVIRNENSSTSSPQGSTEGITLDANGDAIFGGSVSAKRIVADTIESPELSLLKGNISSSTEQIVSLEDRVRILEEMFNAFSSSSSALSPVFTTLLAAENGLSVSGLTILNGGLAVDEIRSSGELISFMSDTFFFGKPYFNSDTGGFAVVRQGDTSVDVKFDKDYLDPPIVNASISMDDAALESAAVSSIFSNDVNYVVTKKNAHGFTIRLNKPAPTDIGFSWIALAVKNAKTFFSLQASTSSADVVVPPSSLPSPPAPPEVVTTTESSTLTISDSSSTASSTSSSTELGAESASFEEATSSPPASGEASSTMDGTSITDETFGSGATLPATTTATSSEASPPDIPPPSE